MSNGCYNNDKTVLEMKKVEKNTIKTTHYDNWLECHA